MTNEIEIGWRWWWWCCCCSCLGLHVFAYFWCGLKSLMKKWQNWQRQMCACVRPCVHVSVCEVIKANHCKRHITYEATSIIGCQRFGKWVVALWNWICKQHLFSFGRLIGCSDNHDKRPILVSSVRTAHSYNVSNVHVPFVALWCLTRCFFLLNFIRLNSLYRFTVAKIADSFELLELLLL